MRGKGVIDVALTASDRLLNIVISDSGPGIRPDSHARLFTPFVTSKSRGTGLGLSTVKRLVEAHAGTIAVECPRHGGTAITVSLPLATL